MFVFGGVESP